LHKFKADGGATMSQKAKKKAVYYESQYTDSDLAFQKEYDLVNLKPVQQNELVKQGILCFKCRMRRPNYAMKQDKVCRGCFMESMVNRFKSSLRTNCKIWKDDLNLVCISGGSGSMALIDLLANSLFEKHASQRKMFFSVHCLWIDEGSIWDWSEERRAEVITNLEKVLNEYGFSYTIIPLEAVFDASLFTG
jgi:hypothetical protein